MIDYYCSLAKKRSADEISAWVSMYIVIETGIILCMRPDNERWRYAVTRSLIDWTYTQNNPW